MDATEPRAVRADGQKTVLIVEDEPTVRMLIAEVLEDLDYIVIKAGDGAIGLRLLQSNTPIDLLVTDMGLPGGLNGRQLADAGRAMRPTLMVLFITGYGENAVIDKGDLKPGMQILAKPFTMAALAIRVRELIAAA